MRETFQLVLIVTRREYFDCHDDDDDEYRSIHTFIVGMAQSDDIINGGCLFHRCEYETVQPDDDRQE
jgi:hypothetical protein